jgi:hypothetical protein
MAVLPQEGLEQQALPLEVPQQELVQGHQSQQEVLLQAQEALLLLEQVREQVRLLEALLRAQAGVLAVVEEEVLDLALAVGLQRVVGAQGQDELVRGQAQEQVLAQVVALAAEKE